MTAYPSMDVTVQRRLTEYSNTTYIHNLWSTDIGIPCFSQQQNKYNNFTEVHHEQPEIKTQNTHVHHSV